MTLTPPPLLALALALALALVAGAAGAAWPRTQSVYLGTVDAASSRFVVLHKAENVTLMHVEGRRNRPHGGSPWLYTDIVYARDAEFVAVNVSAPPFAARVLHGGWAGAPLDMRVGAFAIVGDSLFYRLDHTYNASVPSRLYRVSLPVLDPRAPPRRVPLPPELERSSRGSAMSRLKFAPPAGDTPFADGFVMASRDAVWLAETAGGGTDDVPLYRRYMAATDGGRNNGRGDTPYADVRQWADGGGVGADGELTLCYAVLGDAGVFRQRAAANDRERLPPPKLAAIGNVTGLYHGVDYRAPPPPAVRHFTYTLGNELLAYESNDYGDSEARKPSVRTLWTAPPQLRLHGFVERLLRIDGQRHLYLLATDDSRAQ